MTTERPRPPRPWCATASLPPNAGDLHDVAVGADRLERAVDEPVGLLEQPVPVPDGDGQAVETVPVVDGLVNDLGRADLAALLEAGADVLADLGRVLVGGRDDDNALCPAVFRRLVPKLQVPVGMAGDNLLIIAPDQLGRAILPLDGDGLIRSPVAEQGGSWRSSLVRWRTVSEMVGRACSGRMSLRVMSSAAEAASIAWHCSRSPMDRTMVPCRIQSRCSSMNWRGLSCAVSSTTRTVSPSTLIRPSLIPSRNTDTA